MGLAWGSYFVFGPQTTIDDDIEDVAEELAEDTLGLPDGSLDGDFHMIMPPDVSGE